MFLLCKWFITMGPICIKWVNVILEPPCLNYMNDMSCSHRDVVDWQERTDPREILEKRRLIYHFSLECVNCFQSVSDTPLMYCRIIPYNNTFVLHIRPMFTLRLGSERRREREKGLSRFRRLGALGPGVTRRHWWPTCQPNSEVTAEQATAGVATWYTKKDTVAGKLKKTS